MKEPVTHVESALVADGLAGRPLLPPRIDFPMGGQAVIEGVMMRGPRSYAIAVRRPQGDIVMTSRGFLPVTKRHKWLGLPILRGAVSLVELLVLGYRSLEYSANVFEQGQRETEAVDAAGASTGETAAPEMKNDAPGEAKPLGAWGMAGIFALSMGFAMLLFVALPNLATHGLAVLLGGGDMVAADGAGRVAGRYDEVNSPILYNLVAGAVRVVIIVGYIWAISHLSDIRRLFQYHGAEHKVIMTYEKGLPLDLEHIRRATTVHPRCGTTFIAIVLLVSIVVFALLAAVIVRVHPEFSTWSVWLRKPVLILMHIVFMPLVGGLAYEFTRRAGKRPDFWLYRVFLAPGYAFQKITTSEPEDSMIEVALTSFHEALEPREPGI